MGEPKFSRPKFDTPPHPWKKARIEEEHLIQANHGLKNMREIWKAKSELRRYRRQAMRLIGMIDGIFTKEADIDAGVNFAVSVPLLIQGVDLQRSSYPEIPALK